MIYFLKHFIYFIIGIFLFAILFTYDAFDPSWNLKSSYLSSNIFGYFGASVADILMQTFGILSFFLAIFFLLRSVIIFFNILQHINLIKLFYQILITISLILLAFMPYIENNIFYNLHIFQYKIFGIVLIFLHNLSQLSMGYFNLVDINIFLIILIIYLVSIFKNYFFIALSSYFINIFKFKNVKLFTIFAKKQNNIANKAEDIKSHNMQNLESNTNHNEQNQNSLNAVNNLSKNINKKFLNFNLKSFISNFISTIFAYFKNKNTKDLYQDISFNRPKFNFNKTLYNTDNNDFLSNKQFNNLSTKNQDDINISLDQEIINQNAKQTTENQETHNVLNKNINLANDIFNRDDSSFAEDSFLIKDEFRQDQKIDNIIEKTIQNTEKTIQNTTNSEDNLSAIDPNVAIVQNEQVQNYKTTQENKETNKISNWDKFEHPNLDILNKTIKQFQPQLLEEMQYNSTQLLKVLNDFGVTGTIVDIHQGPVITLYEFEPAPGIKSSRVIGLSDDIARSLCATSTRVAIIPGKNALGIEIPNAARIFFNIKELMEFLVIKCKDMHLPIILGKDYLGNSLVMDLAKMPHLLVAGTTGSGKSVGINTMIFSLLFRYSPAECKFIMIDPKMLELSVYADIPHLLTPVVTEAGKAVLALKWAVKEMESRYKLMANIGVRNINSYNIKVKELHNDNKDALQQKVQIGFDENGDPVYDIKKTQHKKMPFIVIIVDEMADLMITAGKDIESLIQRLAQMARAAGIHIVMATQRPSVDVITGVIKANFPSRISFKVISKIDSRTIIGQMGAEQLLGMGDMLYLGASAQAIRAHGPFIDDLEIEKLVDFLKKQGKPDYIFDITKQQEDIDAKEDKAIKKQLQNEQDEDELYDQAVNIVLRDKKPSISYVQRALRISYNKAAILIERMEKDAIISAPSISGKREILEN